MVYYITAKHKFTASVQITASHNSAEYNGMKISKTNALPVGFNTGLKNLLEILDFDGYRLDFKKWWFNVRKFNTEPYLRLLVEADNEQLLSVKLATIKKILNKYE